MRNHILLLLFFGTMALASWSQNSGREASFYLEEQQFKKAGICFQSILKNSPNDLSATIGLGETYLSLQKTDSALVLFQRALAIDPKSPFAMVGLGKVALLNNDFSLRKEYFDRARRTDKTNPEIYCSIAEGCISLSIQDTVTALNFLSQGLNVNPRYARLHLVTGWLEALKKNYGAAANAFERAIFFDPKMSAAYRNLGTIDLISGAYREALAALSKSVELDPLQILVYKSLGDLYYATGKYAEAEKAYQTYFARAEVSPEDKERYAIALFFNKKYKESAEMAEQANEMHHNFSALQRIKGYIAYETGDYQKGLEQMHLFFKQQDPKKLIALDFIYYARMLQKTGKDSLALENYKKATNMDPSKMEIWEELARISTKNRLFKEAASYYSKMIVFGADKVLYNFQVGKAFYFEGDNWKSRYDSLLKMQRMNKIQFTDSNLVKASMVNYLNKADSAFSIVNQLNRDYAGAYLWRGRIGSILDPEATTKGAKEMYEKALSLLEKNGTGANRRQIIECYRYLGSYFYLGYERNLKTDIKLANGNRSMSLDCFAKIRELDPADSQAKEVLEKFKSRK